jgi:prolyl 4-hydroxylase
LDEYKFHIEVELDQPLVFTAEGLLSGAECEDLIRRIEAEGCAPAPVTTARGFVMRPEVRNNSRALFDDFALAGELFRRARPHLPAPLKGMAPVGVNERFRGYRYEPGQRFAPHLDGSFVRDEGERSLLTFMIYLNEGFEGGGHEGCEVTRGVKYVLRSDIMYREG